MRVLRIVFLTASLLLLAGSFLACISPGHRMSRGGVMARDGTLDRATFQDPDEFNRKVALDNVEAILKDGDRQSAAVNLGWTLLMLSWVCLALLALLSRSEYVKIRSIQSAGLPRQ